MSSSDVRAASSADADPVVVHVDLEDLLEELKAFNDGDGGGRGRGILHFGAALPG